MKPIIFEPMKWEIETKRLGLREMTHTDAESAYLLNMDSEVLKYTGDVAFKSIVEAEKFLLAYDDYKRNGCGRWAVVLKETGDFLGWCGLKRHAEGFVDLGFRFFKNEWNKGYATESARACLQYGFNELEIQEIIGRAATKNKASISVLKKVGMEFLKKEECNGLADAEIYRISVSNFVSDSSK